MSNLNDEILTDHDLDAIDLRANRATQGPWISYVEGREEMSGSSFISTQGEDIYLTGGTTCDQDFVAFARTDVPSLIQVIRKLRDKSSNRS